MDDGDFEIDGYLMGKTHPVLIESVRPGVAEVIGQDSNNPVGNNRVFGRDYLITPIWQFDASMGGDDALGALAALAALSVKWRLPSPATLGWETILRYRTGDRTRLIYGRPRNLSFEPGHGLTNGHIPVSFEFQTSDTLHYEDGLQSVTVDGLPPEGGGLTPPFTPPVLLAPSGPRSGIIPVVGGDAPAPVMVTVEGPTAGPVSVSVGSTVLGFASLPLAFDQSVTVDTRRMTVLRNDGASLAGLLSRRTFLSDVRLHPGPAEIIFNGPVGARCIVSWRPAHHGF